MGYQSAIVEVLKSGYSAGSMRKTVVFLLLSVVAMAADHAPLPQKLLAAKTIYIDNRSSYSTIADKVYSELTKWNRFQVVDSPDKADIVFLLSSTVQTSGYTARTTTSQYGNTSYGNTSIAADEDGFTHLQIISRDNGQILWAETRRWVMFRSATKGIVKDLRKRMEDQEKASR